MNDELPAEFLLDGFPAPIRETGRALRTLVLAAIPGAVETVRPGWRWIAYSLPEKGRVRNFAWIGPERKHIHLGFENGILLADPDRLLQGAQERLRKFRYVTFEPAIDVDEAILVDYIERAAQLAVMPTAARRALAETAAEPVTGALDDVPPDWELIDIGAGVQPAGLPTRPASSRSTSAQPGSVPRQRRRSSSAPSRRRT
jgi:hypothetical protein